MKTLKVKDKIWIHCNGRTYAIAAEKNSRRGGSDTEQDLIAPFACKVLKVHAKPGATLKKGDPVVVVEAMKMEYAYAAPKDGEIESILVKEGQILSAGDHFVKWKASK